MNANDSWVFFEQKIKQVIKTYKPSKMISGIKTGYVASSHSIQSYFQRVLKMLLSEPLASLITFSGQV